MKTNPSKFHLFNFQKFPKHLLTTKKQPTPTCHLPSKTKVPALQDDKDKSTVRRVSVGERGVSELHAAYQTICDPPINSPPPHPPGASDFTPLLTREGCVAPSTKHNSTSSRGATESRRIHPALTPKSNSFSNMDVVTANGHSISTIKKWILVSTNISQHIEKTQLPIDI